MWFGIIVIAIVTSTVMNDSLHHRIISHNRNNITPRISITHRLRNRTIISPIITANMATIIGC